MHDRIKELAEQAVEETQLMMIMEFKNFESKLYEKFAELIVLECGDFVATALMKKIGQLSASVIATDLVEHFGVEE